MSTIIYIIEKNRTLANCIFESITKYNPNFLIKIFADIYSAWEIFEALTPDLIFMNPMPIGPSGFTLLNETISFEKFAKIPVVLLSADSAYNNLDLSDYNIRRVLNLETFTPSDIKDCLEKYCYEKF